MYAWTREPTTGIPFLLLSLKHCPWIVLMTSLASSKINFLMLWITMLNLPNRTSKEWTAFSGSFVLCSLKHPTWNSFSHWSQNVTVQRPNPDLLNPCLLHKAHHPISSTWVFAMWMHRFVIHSMESRPLTLFLKRPRQVGSGQFAQSRHVSRMLCWTHHD